MKSPVKTTKKTMLPKKKVQEMFERLASAITPKPELEFGTLLDLLVAVVLSAQTTDKAVNAVTRQLWQRCRTPQDYLDLGQAALEEHIKTIGLYRNKAKSVLALCRMLLEKHEGKVPDDFEALTALPGVGRKTANVVLNVGFGHPTLAVDTHVFRVANRTGLVDAPTPEETERAALPRIPAPYRLNAHHYLLLHGRYTCTARNPHCGTCLIADICRKNID